MFFSSAIFADEYSDLILSISNKQPYEASFLLKQYQETNPSFGNVYYQMGKIFYEMIPTAHPLYDFSEISLYMYNARLYFGNCLYYANADEINKYLQYYSDISTNRKSLTYEELSSVLKEKIAKIKTSEQNLKSLYDSFYTMVDRYNHCTSLFSQFNKQYIKIKNAHLLISEEDRQLLTDLELNSDTLKTFISDFQKALKSYPIEGYEPKFTFQLIDFYRLDGLTSSDFLQNDIRLWDYSSWVKTFLSENKKQIEPWRKDMNKEQKRLASLSRKWFLENKKVDLEEPIFADRILLNKIHKMDYQSFMLNYFDFMEQSINVFAQVCALSNVVVEQPTEESLFQQTLNGNDISNRLTKMEEDYQIISNRIEERDKYADFFDEFFSEKPMTQLLDSIKLCSRVKAQILYDNLKTNVETYISQKTSLSCSADSKTYLSVVSEELGNHLVEYDLSGNELRKMSLGSGTPKFIKYNEISQDVFVAIENQSVLNIERCNFDRGVYSVFRINGTIELVDIVNVDDNFILIINENDSGVMKVVVALFDAEGKETKRNFLEEEKSVVALKTFKLSNNNIAIIGKDIDNRGNLFFINSKAEWR